VSYAHSPGPADELFVPFIPEGQFYLVLVRDLLHALEMEGTGRAAFVDQLRWGWPSAALTN
jgi:hypothetical protein